MHNTPEIGKKINELMDLSPEALIKRYLDGLRRKNGPDWKQPEVTYKKGWFYIGRKPFRRPNLVSIVFNVEDSPEWTPPPPEKEVTVHAVFKIRMKLRNGEAPSNVLNEMEYVFKDTTGNAEIVETEMTNDAAD